VQLLPFYCPKIQWNWCNIDDKEDIKLNIVDNLSDKDDDVENILRITSSKINYDNNN